MKFRRDELLSAAEFLGDLYTDGFEFVCYPRDRELYKGSDIYACIDRKVAQEHAALNGDWYIEPMGPFVRNMVQTIHAGLLRKSWRPDIIIIYITKKR